MDAQTLAHIGRINGFCEALRGHPAWSAQSMDSLFDCLSGFDGEYWTFVHYLSRSLYEETTHLLQHWRCPIQSIPHIAIVMAVYRPKPELLKLAIISAVRQVGVDVHLWISIDGDPNAEHLVASLLDDLAISSERVTVVLSSENGGVGLCRNRALEQVREPYFTFLDADDIFHPLRCLHAWLVLEANHVDRVNTGFSRVSLNTCKIVLLGDSLKSIGRTSFLARTRLLGSHGFLAPLRFYEDSEYELRLTHFRVSMLNPAAVGHYQNTELSADYRSLGTRWRVEAHQIEGHPYLHGTSIGEADADAKELEEYYKKLYRSLSAEDLPAAFPALPSS